MGDNISVTSFEPCHDQSYDSKRKYFGRIVAILSVAEVSLIAYECYNNAGTFDAETDFHVLTDDGQIKVTLPNFVKKEQILYYEEENYYVVNFHYK